MKSILKFLIEAGRLKNVKRKGITFYGVKNPHSALVGTRRRSYRRPIIAEIFKRNRKRGVKKIGGMQVIL